MGVSKIKLLFTYISTIFYVSGFKEKDLKTWRPEDLESAHIWIWNRAAIRTRDATYAPLARLNSILLFWYFSCIFLSRLLSSSFYSSRVYCLSSLTFPFRRLSNLSCLTCMYMLFRSYYFVSSPPFPSSFIWRWFGANSSYQIHNIDKSSFQKPTFSQLLLHRSNSNGKSSFNCPGIVAARVQSEHLDLRW